MGGDSRKEIHSNSAPMEKRQLVSLKGLANDLEDRKRN